MSASDNGCEKKRLRESDEKVTDQTAEMSTAKKDDTFESIGTLTMPVRAWKKVVAIDFVEISALKDHWMFNVDDGSCNFRRYIFIEQTDLPLVKIVASIRDALNRIISE